MNVGIIILSSVVVRVHVMLSTTEPIADVTEMVSPPSLLSEREESTLQDIPPMAMIDSGVGSGRVRADSTEASGSTMTTAEAATTAARAEASGMSRRETVAAFTLPGGATIRLYSYKQVAVVLLGLGLVFVIWYLLTHFVFTRVPSS